MERNLFDTSVLDGIIIGRVDPHIYAFTTETIPNYLKVGDTYRAVQIRLEEWRKHYPGLKPAFEGIAKTQDNRIFRDYSVHWFLENERKRQRLSKGEFPTLYYSNEFFREANVKDVEDAIADICYDVDTKVAQKAVDILHTRSLCRYCAIDHRLHCISKRYIRLLLLQKSGKILTIPQIRRYTSSCFFHWDFFKSSAQSLYSIYVCHVGACDYNFVPFIYYFFYQIPSEIVNRSVFRGY